MGNDLTGLSIYRKTNPYERRAAVGMKMMDQSGFAAPLVAATVGQSMGQAEGWDADQEQKGLALLKEGRADAMAQRELQNVLAMAKVDAPAANKMLQVISQQYPQLKAYQGINITGEMKDNWLPVGNKENGEQHMVYLPGLEELKKDPDNEELKKKYIIPIGTQGKQKKAPKTVTSGVAGKPGWQQEMAWNDETGAFDTPVGEPRMVKKEGGSGGGGAQLKATQLNNIRKHLTDKLLPFVPDVKLEDQDVGGEAAYSRVRAALKDGKLQAIADDMQDEITDDVKAGMSEIKATNKAWKKYGSSFTDRPKPMPPEKKKERTWGEAASDAAGAVAGGVKKLVGGMGGNNEQPPPAVLSQLKCGKMTEFANGQIWTLDDEDKPQRVQ